MIDTGGTLFCSKCGKETTENAAFCAGCGASLTGGQPAKKRTWLSTVAGTISVIDGFLKAVLVFLIVVGAVVMLTEHEDEESVPGALASAAVLVILGVLAIAGGVCALRRKGWGWALAGAIAAVIPFFPLGIASTILTVMARDEFER